MPARLGPITVLCLAVLGCSDGNAGDAEESGSETSGSGGTTSSGTSTSATSTTADSSTSTTDGSSTTEIGSSSSEESSTTGSAASCGDGTLDDGELCDDGDDEDGNGCNNDCTPSAELLWELVHDIAMVEGGNRIAINDAGAVAIVGPIFNESYDALTIAVDAQGTIEWAAMYDGAGVENSLFDRGNGAAIDDAGNIYASGRSVEGTDDGYVWVRRYDVGGAVGWTLTGEDTTFGNSAAATFAGDGLTVVGMRPVSAFVTRYDAAGTLQWDLDITGEVLCNDSCSFTLVDPMDDGGVAIAGFIAGPGGAELYLGRYDAAGEEVWLQSIGSAGAATIRGLDAFDSSVRILIASDVDHEVRSYDDVGILEWTLDAPASVVANQMAGATDGDLFFSGPGVDALVIERIGIDGATIWSVEHPAPDQATVPVASGIASGAGRVVLTGAVTIGGQSDTWAVAIAQ